MSYELYFYKREGTEPSLDAIKSYLSLNLNSKKDEYAEWYFENPDTEVHFWLNLVEPLNDSDSNESNEIFDGYENTYVTFTINLIRPDFFGIEAFRFIDKFINDLNLFVLNPQSSGEPSKVNQGELYTNWSQINSDHSIRFFEEFKLNYLPLDKSKASWNYNFNRKQLQKKLGEAYFVPRLFYYKQRVNNDVITVCTWTNHIPCLLPPADYYLVFKKYKYFFKTVEEIGFINSRYLFDRLGNLLNDYDFGNCKIIHPHKALKAKKIFNSTKFEHRFKEFADRTSINTLVNVKP